MVLICSRANLFHVDAKESFRPLAGIMVLIEGDENGEYTFCKLVSVPLRGLWFLSPMTLSVNGTITE